MFIVSLHGNETMNKESDPQRSERTLYGTKAARGTAILPIAPWSVPNQICRVALSNVMWRMVFGAFFPTGTSATNFFVFGSNAMSVDGVSE